MNKTEQCNYIKGIELSGYRSFKQSQRLGPFSKINIFVGKNNCGKSNILRFIHERYNQIFNSLSSSGWGSLEPFSCADVNGMDSNYKIDLGLGIYATDVKRWQTNKTVDSVRDIASNVMTEHELVWLSWQVTMTDGKCVFRLKPTPHSG